MCCGKHGLNEKRGLVRMLVVLVADCILDQTPSENSGADTWSAHTAAHALVLWLAGSLEYGVGKK